MMTPITSPSSPRGGAPPTGIAYRAGPDAAVPPPRAAATGAIRDGRSALVLGGGLAGIAAAVRLADAGWRVTMLERRAHLGGRASSHVDARGGGRLLDNCQHVVLGCCTNLLDLYRRLGVDHLVDWHDRLHFLDRRGGHDVLCRGRLPAPFHLAPSLAKFQTLGWAAKVAIAAAITAMLRPARKHHPFDVDGRDTPDGNFAAWLRRHRQPPEAVERFWNVVVTSALNESPDRVGTRAALQVFRQGFLAHRDAYLVGLPRVPLADLYGGAAAYLERRGGRVMTSTAVRELQLGGGSAVSGVELRCGGRLTADAYVSALPSDVLHRAVPDALRAADPRLARLGEFRASPILGVHLWWDRPVTDLPHAVLVDSPVQWVFNRGADPAGGRGQHLHVVISAAREWVDRPADEIVRRIRGELAAYFPAVAAAVLLDSRVIKERRATFAPVPGVDAIRPPAAGAVRNLFLAGDWCRTGWPATMEGAVRSGYLAAGAVLGSNCLVPDLPAAWPLSRAAKSNRAATEEKGGLVACP